MQIADGFDFTANRWILFHYLIRKGALFPVTIVQVFLGGNASLSAQVYHGRRCGLNNWCQTGCVMCCETLLSGDSLSGYSCCSLKPYQHTNAFGLFCLGYQYIFNLRIKYGTIDINWVNLLVSLFTSHQFTDVDIWHVCTMCTMNWCRFTNKMVIYSNFFGAVLSG